MYGNLSPKKGFGAGVQPAHDRVPGGLYALQLQNVSVTDL